jgi:tRNA 2-thiouridine synthesizing protein A
MSMVLGFKNAPKCLSCLAKAVGREREHLGDQLAAYILSKECLAVGWCWTKMREEYCPWSSSTVAASAPSASVATVEPRADVAWDAGDLGCGDLVLELRLKLMEMRPGQVIQVTARDPGAPADMPAWCGLTGHALLSAAHPVYFIRRKED